MGAGAVVSVVSDGCILGEGTLIPPAHRSPASTCDSKATAVSTSNTRRMSAGISAARACFPDRYGAGRVWRAAR